MSPILPLAHCRKRRPGRGCAPAVLALLSCLFLSACHVDQVALLDPQGPVGVNERTILYNSVVIMLVIVVPTVLATGLFAWWFRAGNTKAVHRPDWAYSGRIELVTWSIPILTITFLGGIAWVGSHELDPAEPLPSTARPLEVRVVSMDWKWLFLYPELGIASVNELVIPAGTPVHFALTSASVMTAFFVPRLGSMIYTMNGMSTQLNLEADHPGSYWGEAAHFSGDGFPGMHFEVKAVSAQAFSDWVARAQTTGPGLDGNAYLALLRQSKDVAPYTYRGVSGDLYEQIVTQALPPGPGPEMGRPNSSISPRSGG